MKKRIVLFLSILIAAGSVAALGCPRSALAAVMSEAECNYHSGLCLNVCDTVEAGGGQKVIGTCKPLIAGHEEGFCCAPKDVDMNAPKPSYTDVQCTDHFATCQAKCKTTDAIIGTCTKGGKTMNCCQSLQNMQNDSKYMAANECKTQGGSCVSNPCDKSNPDCIDIGTCYQPQLQAEKVGFCVKFVGVTAKTAASSTAKTPDATTQTTQEQPPKAVAGGIPQLSCEATGNCTIQDIVTKGIAFASFIMGLSGAMFLLVFVYGGAMYVLSFGKSTWVDKGKKAMIQACIGIILVMGAWTIVFYVSKSLGYKAPSVSNAGGTTATVNNDSSQSKTGSCICKGYGSRASLGGVEIADAEWDKKICPKVTNICASCKSGKTIGCTIKINKSKDDCAKTSFKEAAVGAGFPDDDTIFKGDCTYQ